MKLAMLWNVQNIVEILKRLERLGVMLQIVILRLGLNGSGDSDAVFDFLLHCWRTENYFEIFGGLTLFLDFDGSEVVDRNPVVVVLFIGSLM